MKVKAYTDYSLSMVLDQPGQIRRQCLLQLWLRSKQRVWFPQRPSLCAEDNKHLAMRLAAVSEEIAVSQIVHVGLSRMRAYTSGYSTTS